MKRSKFSLSHYNLLTANMGDLIPIGLVEVLPGDTVQHATSMLLRCSPLVAPPMHPVHVSVHHWFVPNRIVWDGWEDFITGGPDGMNNDAIPSITFAGGSIQAGNLADLLGIPPQADVTYVNALPFRAYNLIFNEWYRDQDLQAPATLSTGDGDDAITSTALAGACWEKDYFTTCRPWEAKGPAITLPLGTTAPVAVTMAETGTTPQTLTAVRNNASAGALLTINQAGTLNDPVHWTGIADLSTASAVSINVLREALALQRFEEARARYGSRYTEYLRYLGVKSSDARLQRPEYLGGGKQTIQFSEVLSTNVDTSDLDAVKPGQFGGHGIAAMRSNRYRRFFEEHGYIMSLMVVRPKTMYANSLPRHWSYGVKEHYWQREMQHIGQQEVWLNEVYNSNGDTVAYSTFGYQDRYDQYRRQESRISGEFSNIYSMWHFARNFGSAPTLNADFVKCVPSIEPFADQTHNSLLVMANHNIQARRLVSPRGNSLTF
ncbi:MAG: major capsid protein [Microviridae sp.]|nr:MAG: major capsid protein [Microviridae sp.]